MKLFFTFLLTSQLLTSQVWVQLADYPALKRDDGVAVIVDNKAYFGTGLIEWSSTADFHALDLSTHAWASLPSIPNGSERQYACAFAGPNCFYVFGGDGNGGALNNLYKYDISSSTWSTASSKPGSGLIAAACMNFGDKIIISGGRFQSGKSSAEVWEYTISSDTWAQKNNYPFAGRWRASAAAYNNSGYLVFGIDSGGAFRKEFYKYIPATDIWVKIMDFPTTKGRAYSSLNVASNKLVVFGGIDTLNNFYKDLWYFEEGTSTWTQGPDMPSTGRKGGMSCASGNNLFYSCGLGEGPTRLTETWMTAVPVGIKENSSTNFFSLYPNPTNGIINFNSSDNNMHSITFSCSDISGRELNAVKKLETAECIDLSGLKAGIYFLKFYSENKLVEVKRIVKN